MWKRDRLRLVPEERDRHGLSDHVDETTAVPGHLGDGERSNGNHQVGPEHLHLGPEEFTAGLDLPRVRAAVASPARLAGKQRATAAK